MRQVVLDTETTGLEPKEGHRVIEIGALELVDRQLTGRSFHAYLNPDRDIDAGALEVHGINEEFLLDKPRFAEIADDFLAFVSGSELLIHNAPFDIGFIDNELAISGHGLESITSVAGVLDTLELAKGLHPGQRNNLDALCKRYDIDNSSRSLHGALLDAELLAEVYLAMTGGQTDLGLTLESPARSEAEGDDHEVAQHPPLLVVRATDEELESHAARLREIDKKSEGNCLYLHGTGE